MFVLPIGSADLIVSLFLEPVHLNTALFTSSEVPITVITFGHSFVKRLHSDLQANFDPRADNLSGTTSVFLHGIGG